MYKIYWSSILSIIIFIFLLALGCQSQNYPPYVYQQPKSINDGLTTGSLGDVGLDTNLISKGVEKIRQGKFNEIHSLLIYLNNKLVLEEYFDGHTYQWDQPRHHGKLVSWNKDRPHAIMSNTKSITSACVGIAVDKGFVRSVDQSIFDFLPNHSHLKRDGKKLITIEHLLTMTPGLEWNEWREPYSDPKNPIIGIWFAETDPVSFILQGRLVKPPGTHFSYYGGSQILLGEIIKNATGMPIDSFSQQYLFDPLQIENASWSTRFNNGVIEAAGGLMLKPRDMVKVGATFLNGGKWNGNQIVSSQWVDKSARPYKNNLGIKIPGESSGKKGYSYSWWIDKLDHRDQNISAFHAEGWGGQKIIVIPKLDAVVVFTGGDYTSKNRTFKVLDNYILPSFK